MDRNNLSLRWRMIFIIAGILVVLLTPIFLFARAQYINAYQEAYLGKGDLITLQVKQIIETVAPYVITLDDAPGLSRLLQDITSEVEAFEFVALVEESGRIIEHSNPEMKGKFVPELRNLVPGQAIRRTLPEGEVYLASRAMPLPGQEDRTLYIVVGEDAGQVSPLLLRIAPLFLIPLFVGILIASLHASIDRLILRPLDRLIVGAVALGAGDLSHTIALDRKDELGVVADAFNEMAQRLKDLVRDLEQRVAERTAALEQRTVQLETVGLVSKEAAQVRDVILLLETAADAISEKFGFYHTGIFVLDDVKEWAILRAASSEGGQRMLARGHRLRVGEVGIVGFVADTGQPRIAFDVGVDAEWFNNPDLPMTRSEIALPLTMEDEVIGVLDVQSEVDHAFTDEDISILQLLADQIAIALHNARLMQGMEGALEELQEIQADYSRQGWARVAARLRPMAYEYDRVDVSPVPPFPVPSDLREGQVSNIMVKDGATPVMMEEMRLGQRVLGYVGLADSQRVWTEEEKALVASVSEQVASALETARLFEESQRTADQQLLISRVLQVAAAPDIPSDQVLLQIARVLAHGLDLAVVVFTFPYPDLPFVHPYAVLDPEGNELDLFREEFPLSEEHYIFFRGLTRAELGPMAPLLGGVSSVSTDEQTHRFLTSYNFDQVLYVPLRSAGVHSGFIAMIQRVGDSPLDPDIRELAQNLASQIAVVIENLNLTAATKRRVEALGQLYNAGVELITVSDVEELLGRAARVARNVFDAGRAVIFFKNPEAEGYLIGHSVASPAVLERFPVRSPGEDGLTDEILASRESILIRDRQRHSGPSHAEAVAASFFSMVAVPLQIGEEAVGVFYLDGESIGQFDEDDRQLLEFFASQVAAAIQNALQFDKTEQALSVVERQALYRTNTSEAVTLLTQDGSAAMAQVLRLLGEAANVDVVFYAESIEVEVESEAEMMWRLAEMARISEDVDISVIERGRTLSMSTFPYLMAQLRDEGYVQGRPEEFPPAEQRLLSSLGMKSLLSLAVPVEGRPPGMVALAGIEEEILLGAEEIAALQTASAAISNTLAREHLLRQVRGALAEQETLYEASAELNLVQTYEGILDVLREYTLVGENSINISINYFDRPWTEEELPTWIYVLTRWTELPPEAVSDRYPLQAFPSASDILRPDRPVIVEDVRQDERLDDAARQLYVERYGAASTIFIPLVAGRQWIGYVNAIYAEPRTFPPSAVRRLVSLSGQAAVAIQNLRQLRTIEARARRERMIREITESIQAAPDVQGVLQAAVRELGRALGAPRNVVHFRPPEQLREQSAQQTAISSEDEV
ncbi:MAG: GAF domain-containing protein [Anaerolineales bacterium]